MAEITYVWQQVAARIEADIASGVLPPGAMIRGERAMAEEYGVAITTVRRAVRELQARGLTGEPSTRGALVLRVH